MDNIKKEYIILSKNKYEFIWFIQEKSEEEVLELLDDKGIELLYQRDDINGTINGILTSNNSALEYLFLNKNFCLFIDKYFYEGLEYICSLNELSVLNYAKHLKDINKEEYIEEMLFKVNASIQIKLLEDYINIEDITKDFFRLNDDTISYSLQNIITMGNSSIINRFNPDNLVNRNIKIPNYLLNSKGFNDSIISTLDYFKYRKVINSLEKNNDVENIENKREFYVDNILSTIDEELLNVYNEMYSIIKKDSVKVSDLANVYENITNTKMKDEFYNLIQAYPYSIDENVNLDYIFEYLKLDTNHLVSNMIVDYHFKDSFEYVSKSIKSIMDYVTTTGKKLISNERLYVYYDFYNIENLTIEEKLELHSKSKKYDLVSMLYDDVRLCKDSSYNSLKEEMINDSNYNNYLDKELSNKYGVNVLNLNGQNFRMLIKSLNINVHEQLSKDVLTKVSDGGSYSYIGSEKLSTFYDPNQRYNIVYTDFNINNIVHSYPVDSFSSYSHESLFKNQLNIYNKDTKILSPTDLIKSGDTYNELIIAQNNPRSNFSHILSNPNPSYILCYDKINYNQFKSAKDLGLGLVLVDTSKYNMVIKDSNYSMSDRNIKYFGYTSPLLEARRKYKNILEIKEFKTK